MVSCSGRVSRLPSLTAHLGAYFLSAIFLCADATACQHFTSQERVPVLWVACALGALSHAGAVSLFFCLHRSGTIHAPSVAAPPSSLWIPRFCFWQKGASLKASEASAGAFDRVPLRWSADSLGFVVGPSCESAHLRMPRLVTSGHCFQGLLWPRSILAELETSAPTRPIPAAPASGSAMSGNGDLPLNCGERMRSGLNCHGGCSAHCGFHPHRPCAFSAGESFHS